jgi:hypothetical protein
VRRQAITFLAAASLLLVFTGTATTQAGPQESMILQAAKGTLRPALLHAGRVTRVLPTLSAGLTTSAQATYQTLRRSNTHRFASNGDQQGTYGCAKRNNSTGQYEAPAGNPAGLSRTPQPTWITWPMLSGSTPSRSSVRRPDQSMHWRRQPSSSDMTGPFHGIELIVVTRSGRSRVRLFSPKAGE